LKEEDAISLLINTGCSPEVIEHCKTVAAYARKIAQKIKACAKKKGVSVDIDEDTVFLGGLLHDIGRSSTHGISHAVEGAKIARRHGLNEKLVNIIERHIGGGITMEEAKALGLPAKSYLPVTLEEKIVAHADNLVSGSKVCTLEEQVSRLRDRKVDERIIQRIVGLNNQLKAMMC